uniref:Single stranded DNA binding protein 4 n=1 Tax=Seriola lalandi dorsalis TaxID=1841481 RepID=A0A3B4WKI4_SERLL
MFKEGVLSGASGRMSGVPLVLALYVYEYLLHVGAQKSAQTFLSEIRWEKNITLGEPPGFLHSWWCVFWDLYCAAPDRRETCEHSSEAKAFHDYSAAAAPSPVMGNMPPNDAMPGGPMPPGFFQPFMSPRYPGGPRPALRMPNQPPGGIPGSQPLLPNSLDPTRPQGTTGTDVVRHLTMSPALTTCLKNTSLPFFPSLNKHECVPSLTMHHQQSVLSVHSSHHRPITKVFLSCFFLDSTNSSENIYTMMNPIGPGGNRPNFPMGPGPDGPMGAMGAMEPHHMNGSLGSGDMDGLPKSSPNNMGGMNNPPGTPRDDGEMGGNFLNPFQSESYSPNMTMSV